VDYAFTPYGDLGNVHRISVTMPFGRTVVEEEKIIRRMERSLKSRQDAMIQEHFRTAEAYLKNNDFAKAKLYYEKIQTLNPQFPGIKDKITRTEARMKQARMDRFFQNGMKAYRQEEFLAALVQWNKVAEEAPEYKDIKKWINAANQKWLQTERGVAPVTTVRRQQSRVGPDIEKGLASLQAGDYGRALEIWQNALLIEPDNAQVRSLILKAKARRQKEIEALLSEADEDWEDEKWVDAVKLWRRVLNIDSRQPNAQQALEDNAEKIQSLANELYVKSVDNYVQNRFNEAISNWRQILILDPDNQKAKKHLESVKRKLEDMQTLEQ
jgi:tetratricopeptide (TPR) repeat protein